MGGVLGGVIGGMAERLPRQAEADWPASRRRQRSGSAHHQPQFSRCIRRSLATTRHLWHRAFARDHRQGRHESTLEDLNGHPLLAAVRAGCCPQWRYQPTLLMAILSKSDTTIDVIFSLNQ